MLLGTKLRRPLKCKYIFTWLIIYKFKAQKNTIAI